MAFWLFASMQSSPTQQPLVQLNWHNGWQKPASASQWPKPRQSLHCPPNRPQVESLGTMHCPFWQQPEGQLDALQVETQKPASGRHAVPGGHEKQELPKRPQAND
jgi:hypothetical protein